MRGEGTCGGSAGDGVHHRRLDFEVAARVEEGAEGTQDGGPFHEDFTDVGWAFGLDLWRFAHIWR